LGDVLNLATAVSRLQLVTGAAVVDIAVHASFLDLSISGTATTPGDLNTAISLIGVTPIVPPPLAGINRNVKFLSIQNTSGLSCPVAVQRFDGVKATNLFAMTLSAGWTIQYNTDGAGFVVYDQLGNIQQVLGT
jgi:hypothetical protein